MVTFASRLAALILALAVAGPALAHPHVWVSAKADLVYGSDGRITAVRHHWTFDEAYSAFAVQGLDANGDGRTTPDELAELAKVNTASLAEFGFFTALKANGAKQAFGSPLNETMSFEDGRLTLHFELPLARPAAAQRVMLDVYDPTFFVDFAMSPDADAVTLANAPAGCTLRLTRPKAAAPPAGQTLSETIYQELSGSSDFGGQFASRSMAVCP